MKEIVYWHARHAGAAGNPNPRRGNSNSQTPNPNSKDPNLKILPCRCFELLDFNFAVYLEFGAWDLGF
jgi:hypothetical protein